MSTFFNGENGLAVRIVPATPRRRVGRARTKRQPPYAVVVLNDDDHTFEYVTATFRKVFGYAMERSFSLAKEIHWKGRGIVWQGSLEVAELKRDQIRSAGPDFFATKKVDYPLAVELERLPQ
jgi:ATP-dependent Clp protease adaptor protein ClpS